MKYYIFLYYSIYRIVKHIVSPNRDIEYITKSYLDLIVIINMILVAIFVMIFFNIINSYFLIGGGLAILIGFVINSFALKIGNKSYYINKWNRENIPRKLILLGLLSNIILMISPLLLLFIIKVLKQYF